MTDTQTDRQTHLDPFSQVFLLFRLQSKLNEQLLEFLVAVVDAKLLKMVRTKDLKTIDVQ